jgi:hypothetical protein
LVITGAAGPYRFRLLDFASATIFTPGTIVSNALSPANSTVFTSSLARWESRYPSTH